MKVLGVNAHHPDASAALYEDGRLIWAAEEERFSRIKHHCGFPALAIQAGCRLHGIRFGDLDAIAVSKDPGARLLHKLSWAFRTGAGTGTWLKHKVRAARSQLSVAEQVKQSLDPSGSAGRTPKVFRVEHHLAHAASAYFVSGWDDATFLTVDGLGDFASASWGYARGTRIRTLGEVRFPHSLGFLYSAATHFLGFRKYGEEFKVMGLAALGRPVHADAIRRMVRWLPGGRYALVPEYFVYARGSAGAAWYGQEPDMEALYSGRWRERFGPERNPSDPLTERDRDLAASVQAVLEEGLFHILRHAHRVTGSSRLCLAGGVAFNSLANGKIESNTPFKEVYIQPAAGDAGTALGAAAYVSHVRLRDKTGFKMDHAYWGDAAEEAQIVQAFAGRSLPARRMETEELVRTVARALAAGRLAGWFRGRMEFGPRALGNRSILADPRDPEMKNILNLRVKHREDFRPFAPAVPEELASEYFELSGGTSPFMAKVVRVRPDQAGRIPAVTHADGTARVQTVSRQSQPVFWELLMEFGKLTGVPVLLNTSFNDNEPIVHTPAEAVDCFLRTHMDVLAVENWYAEKTA